MGISSVDMPFPEMETLRDLLLGAIQRFAVAVSSDTQVQRLLEKVIGCIA
jgi:hypothetical protein